MTKFSHILLSACTSAALFCSQAHAAYSLDELTIDDIQQKVKQGNLSYEALVRHYLARIEQHDDNGAKLNAVVAINPKVIERARALDKMRDDGKSLGPLHGIPVLLKDNIDTADGMANTAGSWALKDNYPAADAFVVKQLRDAGAIILGKVNLSEWANFRSTRSSSGWSGLHGQTKNPYDVTRSPCGSSSGSGVAVSANFTVLAVGTETDGSVTCPSAINGIVGIKPTLGTVSRSGIIPIAHSQDTAGPMARTVSDAVYMLQAMVARDKKDEGAVRSKIDYASHLKADGLKGKRIGVVRNLTGYHSGVDKVFEQALQQLREQGAIIVDNANIDTVGEWGDDEYTVLLYEFKADINAYLAGTKAGLPKTLSDLIAFNNKHTPLEMPYFGQEIFEMAQAKGPLSDSAYRTALKRAKAKSGKEGIDATLAKYDVELLVAPTTGPAWKIDKVNGDNYSGSASSAAAVSGYPHITVPMGDVQGLPVGLSFFSGHLAEGVLIEAAFGFEQATKHRQKPHL